MRAIVAASLAILLSTVPAAAGPRGDARYVAGAWVEEREGKAWLVVGLYGRTETKAPETVFVGLGTKAGDEPGAMGAIPKDGWTEVALPPGTLVLAERPLSNSERDRPPAVLVARERAKEDVDVHRLVDGEAYAGAILFERPSGRTTLKFSRNSVTVGESVEARMAAPAADYFSDATLEVARVARRLGVDSDDPDSAAGYARVTWLAPEGDKPAARELKGAEGEKRIREFFTNPKCPWAERNVGWLDVLWVLEYERATALAFRVETDAVKAAGRVSDLWKGYGAWAVEAIHANGFGGTSVNHDAPALLVVPKGTPTKTVPLR